MILIFLVFAVAVPMRGTLPVYVAGNASLAAALVEEAAENLAPVGLAGDLLVFFVVLVIFLVVLVAAP